MATYDKSVLGKYSNAFDQNVANANAVYNAGLNSVNAQNNQATAQYQDTKANALKTLENSNANAYSTYQKYNGQNGGSSYGSNVSNYLKNAAYGTYLNGLGTNQQTYNTALTSANTTWNDWLASKASQLSELEENRQTTNDNWYQYYKGKVDEDASLAEQQRQFDEQLAEDKRQYDTTMAYNIANASTKSTSSGYSQSGDKEPTDTTSEGDKRYISTGATPIVQVYTNGKWVTQPTTSTVSAEKQVINKTNGKKSTKSTTYK